jgi:hypothetical protein
MNRPSDFDEQARRTADAEIADLRERQRRGEIDRDKMLPDFMFDLPHFREAYYCGWWMERKLRAEGVSDERIESICFANGQKCAMSADPWVPTVQTWERWLRERTHDEPGAELAERLLRESDERKES